jgi:mannose-6-phosphate isomerase-like protein (cupin superfamily)
MAAARSEMEEKLPGMHSSDTIDFIYVISGEIWMTLDDGTEVHLRPGETLVRKRHAPRVEKQGNGAVQFRHLFHRRTPWSLRAP